MDDSMIPLLGDTWQGSLCVISEPNSGNSEFVLRFTFVSVYASTVSTINEMKMCNQTGHYCVKLLHMSIHFSRGEK